MLIIFIGPAIFNGMAGSKRLLNLCKDLKIINNLKLIHYSNSNSKFKKNTSLDVNKINNEIEIEHSTFSLIRSMTKVNDSHSYIYFYGYPSITNIGYLLIAKIFHFKILVDIVEDITIKVTFSSIGNRLKYFSTLFIYKYILKYLVNGFIVISNHLIMKLCNDLGENIKITVLPISVDLNNFPEKNLEDLYKQDIYSLFYGGSFASKDGFEDILNAFKILCDKNSPKFKLVLTGRIDKKRKDYIKNLISDHPYADKINYLGFITDENYYRILNEGDIHLMCRNDSRFARTGFPFKLGEMLATGKPVIVSEIDNVSFYVKDKFNGILIQPSKFSAIVEAVEFIISNPKKAREIGLNGRQTAFKYFDSRIITNDLLNFIKIV